MEDAAPPLPGRAIMDQIWADLVFLHWRLDPALAEPWMPTGARPDVHDGSSWVGLIGFEMRRAGFGTDRPLPYLGDFAEVNVRLYSVDERGRRGVVFASLETERLGLAAVADPLGVRYRWARIRMERHAEATGRIRYASRRRQPPARGARTDFAVRPLEQPAEDPLGVFLTARFGMHHAIGRRPVWVPNTHPAWPLRRAELLHCEDGLLAAAGFVGVADRAPDSVLWSPGVRTQFGAPQVERPLTGRDTGRSARPGVSGYGETAGSLRPPGPGAAVQAAQSVRPVCSPTACSPTADSAVGRNT